MIRGCFISMIILLQATSLLLSGLNLGYTPPPVDLVAAAHFLSSPQQPTSPISQTIHPKVGSVGYIIITFGTAPKPIYNQIFILSEKKSFCMISFAFVIDAFSFVSMEKSGDNSSTPFFISR